MYLHDAAIEILPKNAYLTEKIGQFILGMG
jgi:hypothetical protein